jgi:O-antigen ligase
LSFIGRPKVPGSGSRDTNLLQATAYGFLWVFVFVMPWENAVTLPGFGTLSRAFGLVAFLLGLLAVLESKNLRGPSIGHVLMMLFVAWSGSTYFWTFDPAHTRIAAVSFVQLLAMVWLIWQFAQSPKRQFLLLRAFVLGTLVSSGAILVSFWTSSGTEAGAYYGRYTGLGFNPGDIALILALSLPISMYLLWCDRDFRFRVGLYGVHLLLTSIGILLAASRGALLASFGATLMLPALYQRLTRGQRMAVLGAVTICGVGAVLTVPQTSWSRLGTISSEVRSGTLNERTMIWQAGWVVFGESPFLGVGTGAFAPAIQHNLGMAFQSAGAPFESPSYAQLVAHNTYISVLVEEGVIGFAIFLGILLTLLLEAWGFRGIDRMFWLSLLTTWGIGASGLTWEDRKPSWFIFGLLLAASGTRVASWGAWNGNGWLQHAPFNKTSAWWWSSGK